MVATSVITISATNPRRPIASSAARERSPGSDGVPMSAASTWAAEACGVVAAVGPLFEGADAAGSGVAAGVRVGLGAGGTGVGVDGGRVVLGVGVGVGGGGGGLGEGDGRLESGAAQAGATGSTDTGEGAKNTASTAITATPSRGASRDAMDLLLARHDIVFHHEASKTHP